MKFGGMLSETTPVETYAVCTACGIVYKNDLRSSMIKCPKDCGCYLELGKTKEEARDLLDDKYKELLS